MKISEIYRTKKQTVSFEVFPPKKDGDLDKIYKALEQLAELGPDYISVTYGAGGSGEVNRTAEIASRVKNTHGIESLAHLTCITASRAGMTDLLNELSGEQIENVLALRGDLPADGSVPLSTDYRYSVDLIREIHARPNLCVGAACYPEGHIDCENMQESLDHLREKQESGADFFISQLFFDNNLFYRFLDAAHAKGISKPISAGVMPILGRKQIERMIFMCGASLPSGIIRLLHRYENSPDDLRRAGVEHAAIQVADLLRHGVDGVHIYTMNQPDIARTCMQYIGRTA